jgi:flagellar biosynthesis/type III secretory pathway chaperone
MGTEVVDRHLELCDDLLALLQEENRALRQEKGEVGEDLLEAKRTMLPRLDDSLAALKRLHAESPELMPALRDKLTAAQNKIMRILLVDRENEQLLLKTVFPPMRKPKPPRTLQSIKGIYEKHRIPQ